MQRFTEFLMIMCYMWSGLWVGRMSRYFEEGNTEGGLWSIGAVIVYGLLGSWNLAILKQDAKKETK